MLRVRTLSVVVALFGLLAGHASLRAADPAKIDFELYTEGRPAPQTAHTWFQALTKLDAGAVRIRGAKPGDQPSLTKVGAAGAESFRVVGAISEKGEIVVPGGRFSQRDLTGLANWMRTLGDHGVEGVTESKTAFGLTKQQLEAVHADLGAKVTVATLGQKPADVLRKLAAGKHPLVIDEEIEKALASDEPVRDEFQGLSRGTALAALLRPVGGVLVPRKPAGTGVELAILDGRASGELWPVGWASDVSLDKQIPKLLDTLNAEIDGVTAAEAIAAIKGRIDAPLLYDHNGLAAKRVVFDKPVSLPSGKTYYYKLLRDVLSKCGAKYEVRVDENGKPFLWICVK
ncbi:MAG: hypothetical protein QM811_01235 [Pirellulales bacterium]